MTNEREEFEKWWSLQHKDVTKPTTYFQTWQACAVLKDKRIAELEVELELWNEDLRKNKLAIEQANFNQVSRLVAECDELKAKLEAIRNGGIK